MLGISRPALKRCRPRPERRACPRAPKNETDVGVFITRPRPIGLTSIDIEKLVRSENHMRQTRQRFLRRLRGRLVGPTVKRLHFLEVLLPEPYLVHVRFA